MKLGLFGGTFDPPHVGHLIAAQDARTILDLDRIIFVPAASPPHKQGETITAAGTRLAMLRAATRNDPTFEVDDLELKRKGPSYTVDTLREYRERWPDSRIVLLIGADQYAEFGTWREPAVIRELATIAVLTREGGGAELADDVQRVPVTRMDVSSTGVRERVRSGRAIRYLVPEPVEALIKLNQLYVETGNRAQGAGATAGPA